MSEREAAEPVRRSDPLWASIFNALPLQTTDGRALLFSRRAAMADAAWRIAHASPQEPEPAT